VCEQWGKEVSGRAPSWHHHPQNRGTAPHPGARGCLCRGSCSAPSGSPLLCKPRIACHQKITPPPPFLSCSGLYGAGWCVRRMRPTFHQIGETRGRMAAGGGGVTCRPHACRDTAPRQNNMIDSFIHQQEIDVPASCLCSSDAIVRPWSRYSERQALTW